MFISPFQEPPAASGGGSALRILYTNADQLSNKINELESEVALLSPDIIIITEAKPKNSLQPLTVNSILLKGYGTY